MPDKNNNNNWLIYLIVGLLGIAGLKAITGANANANANNDTTSFNGNTPPPKKFGCGCNKGG